MNEFDPYKVLLKKKVSQDNNELPPVMSIDFNDLYELQEFCKQHNIIGFNCGRMNPKFALKMLKSKMGLPNEESCVNTQNKSLLKG
jgi:hypothetical protein